MKYFLFFFLFFFLSHPTYTQVTKKIRIICDKKNSCSDLRVKIKKTLEVSTDLTDTKDIFRFILLDESIKSFSFEEFQSEIVVRIELKPIVKTVKFFGSLRLEEKNLRGVFGIMEGDFFDNLSIEQGREKLLKHYTERGFENIIISPKSEIQSDGAVINILVESGKFSLVKKVNVFTENKEMKTYFKQKTLHFIDKPWNTVEVKSLMDGLGKELFEMGYFTSEVKFEKVKKEDSISHLNIIVDLGLKYNFNFIGNTLTSRIELLEKIKNFFQNNFEKISPDLINNIIKNHYQKLGVYNNTIETREITSTTKNATRFTNFYVKITEGDKLAISNIVFNGPNLISEKKIKEFYYDQATALAARDFLDKDFLNDFPVLLKRYYLSRGFLFFEVSPPQISISEDKKSARVVFNLNEKQQSILENVAIPSIEGKLLADILGNLSNKAGEPLNIVDLEKDLTYTLLKSRENGYYFAKITSLEPNEILQYKDNFKKSEITIKLDTGNLSEFNDAIITGLKVTQKKVVQREIRLLPGEKITPNKIQELKARISALGLYSQVKITPFVAHTSEISNVDKVNVLIQLKEKDFGSGEVAPGYRTDIGYKISTKISYNNIKGLNHSVSLKAQANLRDNLSSLDRRRKAEDKERLEYLVRASYIWPYAFPKNWKILHNIEATASASIQQRRLFSFDADIKKASFGLRKEFDKVVNMSFKYQFERIRQFDSSQQKDNETFTIGGIQPSISFDFRDKKINPSKGAFFSLSWEFANPFFGSLSRDDLEINFWKLISRSKLYYPISSNWVLALSVSTGIQKNLIKDILKDDAGSIIAEGEGPLTKGFIPSIKVFRLDGPDSVRGYATSEINRLSDGRDVSELRIQDKAFFTNIKFESRYILNDQIIVGPFFDAGRIYLNSFKPLDLRLSAGLTLKFVTQVGTLDFDYGFKLKRENLSNSGKEGFGRFHLSIGFF